MASDEGGKVGRKDAASGPFATQDEVDTLHQRMQIDRAALVPASSAADRPPARFACFVPSWHHLYTLVQHDPQSPRECIGAKADVFEESADARH